MRVLVAFALFTLTSLPAAESPAIAVTTLTAPAHANTLGAGVTAGPDGTLWLTWLEREGDATALRSSTLAPNATAWSTPATIVRGSDLHPSDADFPALTAGAGSRATVVWSVRHPAPVAAGVAPTGLRGFGYDARFAQTGDGGRTWSPGRPLTRESDAVEFAALATLPDGRVLSTWIDGRGKKQGLAGPQLFARILGSDAPDTLVDPAVCECCHTGLTAFADGTALAVYRGRTEGDVRDIRAARFAGERWAATHPVFHDGWKIAGCPVNGPQVTADGGRALAAWFTAANDQPRVLATLSPEAGERFLAPLQIDAGRTAGRVSVALLHDGAMLVTSVDIDGALWLRRVTPDFTLGETVRLTAPEAGRIKGFPRVALRRDFRGGKTPAELIVALVRDTEPAVLQTLRVTVPEGELLEAERGCDCATAEDDLLGFSIRGRILAADPATQTVRVDHVALPGIFAAGERSFTVSERWPLRGDQVGQPFVGRIRREADGWQLFVLRVLPKAP